MTELLRSVVACATDLGAVAIFKGGTSLSKGYRLIERFSEDVDVLLVAPAGLGAEARHEILKRIGRTAASDLAVPGGDGEVVQSETGVKRNVRFPYRSRFGTRQLSDGVLLEIGVRGGDHPRNTLRLCSLAFEYALSVGATPSDFVEFAPFDVEVLATERTLVEKLSLLHVLATVASAELDHGALARSGRHYYDIHRLLIHEPTRDACRPGGRVGELADDIGIHSRRHGWRFSPRPSAGYATSPAFAGDNAALETVRAAHRRATHLIYGQVPSFDECLATVHANRELL